MTEGSTPQRSAPETRLAGVLSLVSDKLAAVERELEANLQSEHAPIDDAGRYLAGGGGKLVRPALILLTSQLLGYRGEMDVQLGAVFELIHTATLVHDDIIDEADTRRGQAAVHRVYGNELSILLGDYLYIRSMNMALRARKLRVVDVLAESTERMIEGEILAHHLRGRSDVNQDEHLDIVQRKTAWLFSGCTRVAAILAEASSSEERALGNFGMDLGIAFQLVDDLLDVTADEATLGKPAASDLREGRLTLPWIDLLECGDAAERRAVRAVLESGQFEEVGFDELRGALEARGCLQRARELADDYAERARESLLRFPDSPAREALRELPELIVTRDN